MIINEINKFCAKHGRLTYFFIGVTIIIPFVFLYGDWGGTLQGNSSRDPKIGEIFGKTISRKDFLHQLKAIRINFYLDYQRYLPANNDQVIKALSQEVLKRMRALHKGKKLGINQVTPEEIKEKILNYPAFQEAGEFDRDKFDEFSDNFLKAERTTLQDFDQFVKDSIIVDRIEKQITESVITPPAEARLSYVENFTKCKAHVSTFYSYKYQNEIEVNEEEVEEYFKKNLESTYRVPEQKQMQVVVFDSNKYLETQEITEDELKAYYDEKKSEDYTKKQVRLSHILTKIDSSDSDEDKKKKKKKLEELLKEVKSGSEFDGLAKAHSQDNTSASKGGDLGFLDQKLIQTRYGIDFEKAITTIPVGEMSDIIESKLGYHIVRIANRRDVIPFSETKEKIRTIIQQQRDEEEAKNYYDENRETDYSREEVHARHILLKVDPDDSEEIKDEKRKKLEGILAEAREKKNFYELAKLHSEDQSNSSKGGDLGYFGKGQMVKPFEDVAFSMNKGDISDIVETNFGYHIIEKIDERNVQPFSEVKEEIQTKLKQEKKDKAKGSALEEATKFAIEAHSKLADITSEQKAESFVELCKNYTEGLYPVVPIESGFFTSNDYRIPNIQGSSGKVVKEASGLGRDNPLSEVIESGDVYYVCCWQASKDSYLPSFREPVSKQNSDKPQDGAEQESVLTKQAKKAERDLKNKKAIAKAREECRKAYDEIKSKLENGTAFEEAKGELNFVATGEFTLAQGPRLANAEIIKSEAGKAAANTIVAPKEISQGALLIYIESHSLPSDQDYEQVGSYWLPQFQFQQQQAALENYYKALEAESNTKISEEWQFLFEPEDETDNADES